MLALRSIVVALVALGAAFGLASYAQTDITRRLAEGVVRSLVESAKTMSVELTPQCIENILSHVSASGYERGAVTNRGSVIIRSAGVDTWVCR